MKKHKKIECLLCTKCYMKFEKKKNYVIVKLPTSRCTCSDTDPVYYPATCSCCKLKGKWTCASLLNKIWITKK